MLKTFYAVTANGLIYQRGHGFRREAGNPCVIRATTGDEKEFPSLSLVEHRRPPRDDDFSAKDGMLSIGRELCLYGPTTPCLTWVMERDLWYVSPSKISVETAELIALFLDETGALACVEKSNLRSYDERWRDSSLTVLQNIREGYFRCVISTAPSPYRCPLPDYLFKPSE